METNSNPLLPTTSSEDFVTLLSNPAIWDPNTSLFRQVEMSIWADIQFLNKGGLPGFIFTLARLSGGDIESLEYKKAVDIVSALSDKRERLDFMEYINRSFSLSRIWEAHGLTIRRSSKRYYLILSQFCKIAEVPNPWDSEIKITKE